jgi:hypothetical protein
MKPIKIEVKVDLIRQYINSYFNPKITLRMKVKNLLQNRMETDKKRF